jgi:hypothetical protein
MLAYPPTEKAFHRIVAEVADVGSPRMAWSTTELDAIMDGAQAAATRRAVRVTE